MITPAVKAEQLRIVAELAGHPNAVIAERLRVTYRTVTRYRKLLGLRAWDCRDESYYSHGLAGYKRGCRCDKCATAHREACLRFKRDRLDAGLTPDDPRHGTATGYSNWGCRCEPCRAAGSRNNREAKERRMTKGGGVVNPTMSTLHELPHIVPRSDEWYDQRRGIVTASVVGQLITGKTIKPANNDTSRGLTTLLAAERITGHTEPTYINDDMMRGIYDEPIAVDVYSTHYAPVTHMGFMVRESDGWKLGYSPDGLVGDDGLVEVKSRRQKKQLATILSGEVPLENMAQVQAGLLVSGRAWLDYVSFSGGMPLFVKRVFPDPRWFDAIVAAVEQFEKASAEMVARYISSVVGFPMTERIVEKEMSL